MVRLEVADILGKTITGVVFKAAPKITTRPQAQLFLLFSDGTYYEFYATSSPGISTTGGVDQGGLERVREYMGDMRIEFEAVPGPDGKVIVNPP